ncbi:AaceriAER108Cp [[Ashbya] aceris (nom. inval.)]|nr:AaceriAER108Cp [[Ashbya] aceris (nom. inval.)]
MFRRVSVQALRRVAGRSVCASRAQMVRRSSTLGGGKGNYNNLDIPALAVAAGVTLFAGYMVYPRAPKAEKAAVQSVAPVNEDVEQASASLQASTPVQATSESVDAAEGEEGVEESAAVNEDQVSTSDETAGGSQASEAAEATTEDNAGASGVEETQQGAYNPDTGEINWDCPCLGGMAHGPCGEEFKAAFACFVYSEAEPKGIDCVEKFQVMQDCFRQHPEHYAEQLENEEQAVREAEAAAESQKDNEGR